MEGTDRISQADITEDSQEDNLSDHPVVATIQALGNMDSAAQFQHGSYDEFDVNEDGDEVEDADDYDYDSSSSGHILRFSHELM